MLDDVVSLLENDGRSNKDQALDAGVSSSTIKNWKNGKVYMPQRFTVDQVLHSMGKKLTISDTVGREISVRFQREKKS
jgi:hypothetical protein